MSKIKSWLMSHKPMLIVRPKDPVLINRELDVLYAGIWLAFCVWGILGVIHGLPTITLALGETFNFFWSLGIAVLTGVAFLAVTSLFFKTRFHQITKKRIERVAAVGMVPLAMIYPFYLFIRGMAEDDLVLIARTALAVMYVFLVIYRVRVLKYRIEHYAAKSTK